MLFRSRKRVRNLILSAAPLLRLACSDSPLSAFFALHGLITARSRTGPVRPATLLCLAAGYSFHTFAKTMNAKPLLEMQPAEAALLAAACIAVMGVTMIGFGWAPHVFIILVLCALLALGRLKGLRSRCRSRCRS